MAKQLLLRSWRVSEALPSGRTVWFDPEREAIRLYELEPELEARVDEHREADDQIDMYDPEVDKNELGELPF